MSETEQTVRSCHAAGQAAVRAGSPRSTRAAPLWDSRSRFQGEGVRYKAKLIGMDPLPDAPGEKTLLDSMMKLKGFEAAARKQGKHKTRIWLKVSCSGLKILDERTGIVLHEQDGSRISSVTKDRSDPRALAYVYKHHDTDVLFYIRTATQADPILSDIMEVCQGADLQESPHQPAGTQDISLVALTEGVAPPAAGAALVFSPPPESSPGQTNQTSSSDELMQIFSRPLEEPLEPDQVLPVSQPAPPQPPALSAAQILSMFPTQPPGGAPYGPPPALAPWGQRGPLWSAGVTAPPAAGFLMTTMSPAAAPPDSAPAPGGGPLL